MSDLYKAECRLCGKITDQLERVITDNLPPSVKTLQCIQCGALGVVLVENIKK